MTPARPARTGGRRVDLHSHTFFSDGQLSPEELVDHAIACDVAALGVTDHDTVEAMPRALAAGEGRLRVVPGIEISSTLGRPDVKIVDSAREVRAGLIVMGAYGRNRITDYFLGSNSAAVVRTSPIAVLLAR